MESEILRRVFPGESETAARLRQLDWNSNSLGKPDDWLRTVKSAVEVCLTSRIPMQVWCGPTRSLIYNDAAIEWLGDRHPGVLAGSGREAFPTDVADVIVPAVERVFETGTVEWRENVRMLLKRRLPDQETYATFSCSPITGEHGGVDGVIVTWIDVTDTVLADRRLAALHKLGVAVAATRTLDGAAKALAAALGGNPDVPFAVLYTVNGNEARALAWIGTTEQASGLPALSVHDGPLSAVLEKEDACTLTTHGEQELPTIALPIRAGGDVLIGILVCGVNPHTPIDQAYHSFLDLIATYMSSAVSDGNEATRSAVPPQLAPPQLRSKDAFLSIVAHELRNPLSALMMTLQTLMLRAPSTDLERMDRSVRQLTRIVDNLLDISRIARGRLELRPKPTELANIIDRAMELATPLFNERNTQVFVSVPRVGLRLDVDPERIAQAIANLLTNASRYSETGSRVWIQATREYDRVRLVIKDEGSGIEPDRLRVVFEAFYQAPETRPRTSGIGLGLAIARSLVELHGGTLRVTSSGAGHGTECVIDVPFTARPAIPPPMLSTPASRRRLLLVEDNDDTARALKSALEQLGYVVALAHNGPIAINVARTFDPDVVLMDIGLPVMDGWELAKRLRELRGAAHNAPVVAVTAYDGEADKQRSTEAGFADHLVKPIDLGKLQEVVESLPLRPSSTPS